jgi:hypothetical protein
MTDREFADLVRELTKWMDVEAARALVAVVQDMPRRTVPADGEQKHPRQEPLPLPGLAGQAPCFPEHRPAVLMFSTRPDPAAFGRYLVDSFMQLTREALNWELKNRPKGGWALLENAQAFITERTGQVCSMLGMLSNEAQAAWRDECDANKNGGRHG